MIDWTDAFDNTSYVTDSDQLPKQWADSARIFRDERLSNGQADLDLVYGEKNRNRMDIFRPKNQPHGLLVFVHGGYWQRLDKSYWSHLSRGFLEKGWAVAFPSYTLAPQARISEITQEIAVAIDFAAQQVDGPVRLAGHSAGGHLVSRMVCVDSPLSKDVRQRLAKVVSISGIHDLRPLRLAEMNKALQLSEQEAISESPVLHHLLNGTAITFWVGASERPELIRQTRLIAECWQRQNTTGESIINDVYEAGKNHFSVIEAMAFADSSLTKEILS